MADALEKDRSNVLVYESSHCRSSSVNSLWRAMEHSTYAVPFSLLTSYLCFVHRNMMQGSSSAVSTRKKQDTFSAKYLLIE